MFTVPGWSVAAKVVRERPRKSRETTDDNEVPSINGQKRKRPDENSAGSKLSSLELERLWNQAQKPSAPSVRPVDHQDELATQPSRDTQNDSRQRKRLMTASRSQPTDNKPANSSNSSKLSLHPDRARMLNTERPSKKSSLSQMPGHTSSKRKSRPSSQNLPESTEKSPLKPTNDAPPERPSAKLTPLQAKMRQKLVSSRFRHLNQTLYTSSSSDALAMFTQSPDLFSDYHAGFSQQVKDSWPQNPVEQYKSLILTRGRIHQRNSKPSPLPRNRKGVCNLADLGCGDAALARSCQSQLKNLQLKFHNFDLHASNSLVTAADISSLPLGDRSVDVAIFCLSLMGTNWIDYVEEAWRVLRADGDGELWVSEVKSRFGRPQRREKPAGGGTQGHKKKKSAKQTQDQTETDEKEDARFAIADEELDGNAPQVESTDISSFVAVLARRGFALQQQSVDQTNKMFVSLVFVKSGTPTAGRFESLKWTGREYQRVHDGRVRFVDSDAGDDPSLEDEGKVLKPCLYKTR